MEDIELCPKCENVLKKEAREPLRGIARYILICIICGWESLIMLDTKQLHERQAEEG